MRDERNRIKGLYEMELKLAVGQLMRKINEIEKSLQCATGIFSKFNFSKDCRKSDCAGGGNSDKA